MNRRNSNDQRINIVTCLSIKDVLTYALECKVFKDDHVNVYLISKPAARLILKYWYRYTWINFVDESFLIKTAMNISSFKSFLREHNQELLAKSGWYKQQLLKYAQIVSLEQDAYIVDGDTFPKSIKVLKELQDYRCTISYAPVHEPYEACIKSLLGPSEYHDLSKNYICEAYFIEYDMLNRMLGRIEKRCGHKWPLAIILNVTSLLGFSEYQTYARFEEEQYKGKKTNKEFNTTRNYGEFALPGTNSIIDAESDFVSFESYHTAKVPGGVQFKIKKYFFFFLNKLKL